MNNLPLITFDNLFDIDPTGQKLWSYWLGKTAFENFRERFSAMGAAAAAATPLSRAADRLSPTLQNFDAVGDRVDRIAYHPAYEELKRLSYGREIVSLKYNSSFLKDYRSIRHRLGFAISYYFAQTETGLFCPICMTDALASVLERHNTLPQAQKALRHLTTSDIGQLWEGAMFLTEKQGGSDVGANTVRAEKKDGRWLLFGDKWFCSNADAKAILALARMPGEEGRLEKGTRGLGLFLVLRDDPAGNSSTWLTHRLKDKLGVRSMASGEITFNGSEGFLIAGAGEGFKVMTEMVNMSRLYNAVASVAIVRRAVIEAMAFGRERKAFGQTLAELPLWRAGVADLAAEHLSLLTLVFESIRQLDAAENGDASAARFLRLVTPLAKGLGGRLSVFAASEAMELIGGNAYIEDHILPRLLRDAQVLPIWEGTTNIQSLDLIRALQKEGADPLITRCETALSNSKSPAAQEASKLLSTLKQRLVDLTVLAPADTQRASRELLELSGRTLSVCLLIEMEQDKNLKDIALAAAQRLVARPGVNAPLAAFAAKDLKETEDVLLKSIF